MKLARSVYESICAFLNRRGGHIVLGADNNGIIFGVSDESLQEQLDTLAKDMNNPQLFKPTYYLDFKTLKLDGLNLIHCYVPESTQAHTHTKANTTTSIVMVISYFAAQSRLPTSSSARANSRQKTESIPFLG